MENINLPSKKKWVKVKLGDLVSTITKGSTPTTYGFNYLDKGIPFIKIENIENDKINHRSIKHFISNEAHEYQSRSQLQEGDILFSIAGTIGKTCIVTKNDIPSNTNQALSIIRGTNKYLLPKFLKLQFLSMLSTTVKKKARGGAMSNISLNDLKRMDILLPSIQEQNRIVEKIEELFSDLDKATEDLKKTREQLKIYRQSVLKAAFEGKLLEMNSAEYFPFSEVCDINPSKQEIAEFNDDLEVTFMPMSAVSKSGVILEKKNKKLKDVKKGYTFFRNGDVLLAKITPCFENGKKAIAKELKNNVGFGSTEFHVLRPKEKVISEWIYFGLSLEDFRNEAKSHMTGTVGQKRVPKSFLESYVIPVPTKPIQEEIVNEIESRLSVCDKVEKTVEQNLSKIECLRQSILKKAFEGKLVSQDPNDLPTCELLKQIKIKKDKMSKNGK
jgi:type I restriction enzyme S subunit